MPHAFYWFISDTTPTTQINVIVIDQFEELFTQSDTVEREALVRILEEFAGFRETSYTYHCRCTFRLST